MCYVKGQGQFDAQTKEAMEQNDGVGAPRDRYHYHFLWLDKPMRLDRPPDRGKNPVSHALFPPYG